MVEQLPAGFVQVLAVDEDQNPSVWIDREISHCTPAIPEIGNAPVNLAAAGAR